MTAAVWLAALVSLALASMSQAQIQPHKLMGDALYAAYLEQGPAILQNAFPSGTRFPEFINDFQTRVLPQWQEEECRPSRVMFMFDISLVRLPNVMVSRLPAQAYPRNPREWRPPNPPVDFQQLAQAYLRNRREPPGTNPALDAFEIQWAKTVIARLHGRRAPDLLDAFMQTVAGRIVPDASPDQLALIDPWIAFARGFVEENYILSSGQTCSGQGCSIDRRGPAALDAYAAARRYPVNRPEATVRSARILLLWNRAPDALNMLDALDESSVDDRTIAYWARLIRAKALDASGRHAEAAAEYKRALEIAPQAQSALLGLLLIEAGQGNRDAAARIAARIRTAPDPVADPWWAYEHGDQRFYEERLKTLRRMVTR